MTWKKRFFRQIAKFTFKFMSFSKFFFGLIIYLNFQDKDDDDDDDDDEKTIFSSNCKVQF